MIQETPSLLNASIIKVINSKSGKEEDILAVEEPLEIRLSFIKDSKRAESNLSVTMRTPGNDEELALGFLFTEGIFENIDQVNSLVSGRENCITVSLREDVNFEMVKLERHFYTSSSCGVCGKSSIEAIHTIHPDQKADDNFSIMASEIYSLPSILRKKQEVFEQTGGLHASAIFNRKGELVLLREDVGRHNALDKLIGSALKQKMLPLTDHLLLLSGRASFELLQKATMANIPVVASVGAPSSLAVGLARERGMTLIGFLKPDRFNIYCGEHRIKFN